MGSICWLMYFRHFVYGAIWSYASSVVSAAIERWSIQSVRLKAMTTCCTRLLRRKRVVFIGLAGCTSRSIYWQVKVSWIY